MSVARIGIQRDVGHKAKLRKFPFDGSAGATDEVGLVEGFAAVLVLELEFGVGEERDRRDVRSLTALSASADRLVDAEPVDARHRVTGTRRFSPSMRKSGQIRSLVVSTCSATSRRAQSALRLRRGRLRRSRRWVSTMRVGLFIGLLFGAAYTLVKA